MMNICSSYIMPWSKYKPSTCSAVMLMREIQAGRSNILLITHRRFIQRSWTIILGTAQSLGGIRWDVLGIFVPTWKLLCWVGIWYWSPRNGQFCNEIDSIELLCLDYLLHFIFGNGCDGVGKLYTLSKILNATSLLLVKRIGINGPKAYDLVLFDTLYLHHGLIHSNTIAALYRILEL